MTQRGTWRDLIIAVLTSIGMLLFIALIDVSPLGQRLAPSLSVRRFDWILLGIVFVLVFTIGFAWRRAREAGRERLARGEAERRLAVLFEETPQPMWVFDIQTLRFLAVNRAALIRYGYGRDEFLALTIRDIRPAEDVPRVEALVRTPHGDVRRVGVFRHRRKDGVELLVDITSHDLTYDGHAARLVLATDVTERERALDALRENHELLRSVVDGTSDAVFVKDRNGRYVLVNAGCAALLHRRVEEIIGRTDRELMGAISAAPIERDDQRALAGGQWTYEESIELAERTVHLATTKGPRRNADGEIVGVIGISRDVTERRRAEEEQRATDATLRGFFDAPGVHLAVFDLAEDADDFVFSMPNHSIAEYHRMSVEQLTGLTGRASGLPEDTVRSFVERFRRCQQTGQPAIVEYLGPKSAGQRWFLASLSPIQVRAGGPSSICFVATEITQLKRLEEQIVQSQRMEAVGQLAGAVAHEFNNLLTVILSHARFLDQMPGIEHARADISGISVAAERASSLTRQLLAFARRQVFQPTTLDLTALVEHMNGMLQRLLGEAIELAMVTTETPAFVRADPGQLEQVVINLALNARDAMTAGGTITVRTDVVTILAPDPASHGDVPPGTYVTLAVHDTGHGIEPDVLPHVFEPFFTTRSRAGGSGLGLSTCYGIITQSGGHLHATSEPGHGTTITCYLPRAAITTAATAESELVAESRGHQTILTVEDDPAVRAIAVRTLRHHGFRVLESRDGAEALRIASEFPGAIDLLLTDVVMPKMGGRELASKLTAVRPTTRVLFTSGYTGNAFAQQGGGGGALEPGLLFLAKPYLPSALVRKVREILDGAAPL